MLIFSNLLVIDQEASSNNINQLWHLISDCGDGKDSSVQLPWTAKMGVIDTIFNIFQFGIMNPQKEPVNSTQARWATTEISGQSH